MQSLFLRVLTLSVLVVFLSTMPAFGQEPSPPEDPLGSTCGADTQFTVTLGDTVSFTITAVDSIEATIQAFSSQSLEMVMESVTGVNSTQITVSGLPPGASLFKSEDDLRNHTLITIDELGSFSWVQDLTEPHSVLIKPELSTWYLDDSGWTPHGTGTITQKDHTYSAWYQLSPEIANIAVGDALYVLETVGYGDAFSASYALVDMGSGDEGRICTLASDHWWGCTEISGAAGPQWHNIIVTYDADAAGAEHSIFLDGSFVTTMASSGLLHETTGLFIGAIREEIGNRYWDGWIDDVAFWDRVLTVEEIAAVQQNAVGDIALPAPADITDGLVAYWSFDTDFTATYGGSAFDGTPVNGPVIDSYGQFDGSVRFLRSSNQWVQVDEPVLFQEILNVYAPGTWDPVTKTAVLTEDVFETVQISGTGITLDGGGYRIAADNDYYGVYIPNSSSVTVRNADVTGERYGVYILNSSSVTVRNADVTGEDFGIKALYGTLHTIENTLVHGRAGIDAAYISQLSIVSNPELGNILNYVQPVVTLNQCDDARVEGNTIIGRTWALSLKESERVLIAGNVCTGQHGIVLNWNARTRLFTCDCVIRDNSVIVDYRPLHLGTKAIENEIANNTFISHTSWALTVSRAYNNTLYNNNFISEPGYAPYLIYLMEDMTFNLPAPIGGNYWNTWTGPDADGDGFVDVPYDLGNGQVDNLPYATQDGWAKVAVTGTVSSDCDGPMAGVTVELHGAGDEALSAVTEPDGAYAFTDLIRGIDCDVTVVLPDDYVTVAPETGTFNFPNLTTDVVADFTLGCLFDVTGTVSSDCQGTMAGITVGLDAGGGYITVLTAEDGAFLFEDLRYESEVELTCVLPLGFHPVSPIDGHTILTMTQDETVDFELDCVVATGSTRGMGYWKHQANVYLKGKGTAQELQEDMETNFPTAIFSHFHENDLNGIAVEGVTYMGEGVHVPLDLATIQATLTVNRGQYMLDRAKQHYLALLLNLASGKIQTFTVVAEDGRTASQALQYVAYLINDGTEDNDELVKNISVAMNEARILGVGEIPEDYSTIFYSRPEYMDLPLCFSPNPGDPHGSTTVSFGMPVSGRAELVVYDVAGRKVATLLSGVVEAGRRQITWQGRTDSGGQLAQGVYFARLVTPKGVKTAKFVYLIR